MGLKQPKHEPTGFEVKEWEDIPLQEKEVPQVKRKHRLKLVTISTIIILVAIQTGAIFGLYKVNEWFNKNEFKFQFPIYLQTPIWSEPRNMDMSKVQNGHGIKEAEASQIFPEGGSSVYGSRDAATQQNGLDKRASETPGVETRNNNGERLQINTGRTAELGNNQNGISGIQKQDSATTQQMGGDRSIKVANVVAKVFQLESSSGKHDSCRSKGLYNGYGYAQNNNSWACYERQSEVTALVTRWFEKHISSDGLITSLCYYNTGRKTADCPYYKKYLNLK